MVTKLVRRSIEYPEPLQELLSKSIGIPPEVTQEVMGWLRGYGDPVLDLMFRYGDYHGVEPRVVIDPYRVDPCSKVPPWEFYKHLCLCVYIHDENYKGVHPYWFSALRYNPHRCFGRGPIGAGYSESESFKLFLTLGTKYGVRHITTRRYTNLRDAIKAYWEFNIECDGINTPLAFSTKRGKQRFHIECNVGCVLFESPGDMVSFFYPYGRTYDQPIEELIDKGWGELVQLVKDLPNGAKFIG